MRRFLGDESGRADIALALAAEFASFDALRRELFANQRAGNSSGITIADLTWARSRGLFDRSACTG
jgi:hypothetical protein